MHKKPTKFGKSQFFSRYSSWVNIHYCFFQSIHPDKNSKRGKGFASQVKEDKFSFKKKIKTFTITSSGCQHFCMGVHFLCNNVFSLSAPTRYLNAGSVNIKHCFVFVESSFKDTLGTTRISYFLCQSLVLYFSSVVCPQIKFLSSVRAREVTKFKQ